MEMRLLKTLPTQNAVPEGAVEDSRLSALRDGELEGEALSALLRELPEQPDLGLRWQAYQLIGEGLRRADPAAALAADTQRGQSLLEALRPRLAAEAQTRPPLPTRAEPRGQQARWWAPLAVAASFVALGVGLSSLVVPGGLREPGALQARAGLAAPPLPVWGHGSGAAMAPGALSFAQSAAAPGAQPLDLDAPAEAAAADRD